METKNAKIKDVTCGFNSNKEFVVDMTIDSYGRGCYVSFNITRYQDDVNRLMLLMEYVGVETIQELEGKYIRKMILNGMCCCAIGHIIEDKFFLIKGITEKANAKGPEELTQAQVEEMFKH